MNEMTSPHIQLAAKADVIIEDGNDIYLGFLDTRARVTPDIESQPAWRIVRVSSTEEDGVKLTRSQYANGSRLFNYVLKNYKHYVYDYA